MKKYLFLTSAITLCTICPAMAETFPTNGLMQENKTYDNAAIDTNMDGVYEDSVNAVAQYENMTFTLTAGNYLPANSETITQCPAGSFCDGSAGTVNYSSTAQGIQGCPSGYESSLAGATSNEQCYRACSGNVEIAHASGVTGNDYYGNGVDTCEPTGCVHGWHKKNGLNVQTAVGQVAGENSAYVNNAGSFIESGNNGQAYYGFASGDKNKWAVDYGSNGFIYGQGRCSTRAGAANTWTSTYNVISDNFVSSLTDETGEEGAQYCYCNVTGYKANGGTLQSLSSPWVFNYDNGDASNCASRCAYRCAAYMRGTDTNYLAFRAALLGSVGTSPASCEANTITINWNGTTQTEIDANNAGTATYGEAIRTPRSATHVPGKNFTGWLFVNPND